MEVLETSKEEIIKNAIDDFEKAQRCMILAKEEKAAKTYAELKRQYIVLKAFLTSLVVNITESDLIKE